MFMQALILSNMTAYKPINPIDCLDDPVILEGDLMQLLLFKVTIFQSIYQDAVCAKGWLEQKKEEIENAMKLYNDGGIGTNYIHMPILPKKNIEIHAHLALTQRVLTFKTYIFPCDYVDFIKGSTTIFDSCGTVKSAKNSAQLKKELIENTVLGYKPIMKYLERIFDFGRRLDSAIACARGKYKVDASELSLLRKENAEMRAELAKMKTALTDTLDLLQSLARA